MPKIRKKVETFLVELNTSMDFDFEDLLSDVEVFQDSVIVKRKAVFFKVLSDNPLFLVGIVETSRDDSIPPKKNVVNQEIQRLGLTEEEGLVYANVFIYDKKRSVLMYEVNKSGCYVDHFITFLYRVTRSFDRYASFDLKIHPLLKADQYQRMLNMSFHKSVEIRVANPSKILEDNRNTNSALAELCRSAEITKSKRVMAKFEVRATERKKGLSITPNDLVEQAMRLLRGPNSDTIEKLVVEGYETDSDDGKLIPIDLIADRFVNYIDLNEPRESTDLLEDQRRKEITKLYHNSLDELKRIIGY